MRGPRPVRSRATSAARMPFERFSDAMWSQIVTATGVGSPSSIPVPAIRPPLAWADRSAPSRGPSGPRWPNADPAAWIRRGLVAARTSKPRPHSSSVPGLKFDTRTSLRSTSRRKTSRPAGTRRSMVALRFPRLLAVK